MKPGRLIELTASQTKFINASNEAKAVAFVAGFGSGKTFTLVNKMIQIKLKYPEADILYLCPIFSMMRDILIPTLDEILLPTNIDYKVNKTTGEIVFGKGGRIIIKSMDDPSRIIGMNVVAVFFDELDTLPTNKAKEIWIKAIARARKTIQAKDDQDQPIFLPNGDPKTIVNQLFVATTPEGYRFVYDRFYKNRPDNYVLIQASTRENKFLPEDFVENLEAIYPKELIEAYLDGKFINMTSGTVFSYFDRQRNHIDAYHKPKEPIHVGIDFNVLAINAIIYIKGPSLNDLGIPVPGYNYNDKPRLYAVDHLQKIKDTPELVTILKEKYPDCHITCYPDASGANTSTKGATVSDISILRKAGFRCKHPKKNPAIMNRVLSANSAFQNRLVMVNTNKCTDLTEAFEQQIYDPKTEMPEKHTGPSIDDITDAATYIINHLYPIKRNSFRSNDLKET